MPAVQKFVYEFPKGQETLTVHSWVAKYCSEQEQKEFEQARRRQEAIRAEAINLGRMSISENTDGLQNYVWSNVKEAEKNKENDPVWLAYWDRYQSATGLNFKIIIEEKE